MARPSSLRSVAVALGLLGLLACLDPPPPAAAPAARAAAIVGGTAETGWPAVGALVLNYPGAGYVGSYCTATLIAPRWLVTAAHCLISTKDMDLSPPLVHFLVGSDATPMAGGTGPVDGTLYGTTAFYPNAGYDPNDTNLPNDIGLVYLSEAVTTVAPAVLNTTAFTGSLVTGKDAFYVGFGATEGVGETGGGIKRSASVPIYSYETTTYYSQYDGSGICFGDSGGPGFLNVGGAWKVIGVNSAVSNDQGADPCHGIGIHTRVDAYANWIAGITGGPPPSCKATPDICQCAAACQSDGSCKVEACQTKSCEESYNCMATCGADQACSVDCYSATTAAGRATLDVMFQCFQANCGTLTDATQYGQCATQKCASQLQECMPPANCAITGADCPAGEACYPVSAGVNDCYPTDGTAKGQACPVSVTDRLACADGLICLGGLVNGTCTPLCAKDADCGTGFQCELPLFQGITDIGSCACIDADKDGYCKNDDCDDTRKGVHPGATELCGNGLDDNCDGQTDEGCPVCVDNDNDGSCQPDDCNDNDAAVHPGAAEVCGNQVDDNCNGQTDEGCATCSDVDGDGYCASIDCNDNDSNVHPGAPEICGNHVDDNCDGDTDEGCPTACVDADGDGVCAPDDCNDNDPAIHPGATETCGNGIDDDCNGQTDEGCDPQPPAAGKSGGCAAARSAAGQGLAPVLMLVVFGITMRLSARRRRRA